MELKITDEDKRRQKFYLDLLKQFNKVFSDFEKIVLPYDPFDRPKEMTTEQEDFLIRVSECRISYFELIRWIKSQLFCCGIQEFSIKELTNA